MRVSHLIKGRCMLLRRVCLLLNMHTKKKALQIILYENAPSASTRGAHWHRYAKLICANGHPVALRKKHHVEHKLSEIFELFRLPRV
jgi:hypothetical protein